LALTIVINMFSQETYARADAETLQRFGLSGRTKRILDAVERPVRLTCVYTSADQQIDTPRYRARMIELLEEMREHNSNVELVNVRTDAGKARLLGRLRQEQQLKAKQHSDLLGDFQAAVAQITHTLNTHQQRWQSISGSSYLDLWGLTAEISRLLKADRQNIEKTSMKVRQELSGGGLPEYAALVNEIESVLKNTSERLEMIVKRLTEIAGIPPAVEANRKAALEKADQAISAMAALSQAAGKEGQEPRNPEATLRKIVKAAETAAKQATETAAALDGIAGKEYTRFIRASQAWLAGRSPQAVLPGGWIAAGGRQTVSDLYTQAAAIITRIKIDADAVRKAIKPEHQPNAIEELRKKIAELTKALLHARKSAESGIDRLRKTDAETLALLDQAKEGKMFAASLATISSLLAKIDNLPKLEDTSLPADITKDNIVIIEVGEKAVVADFETLWPLKVRPAPGTSEATKRVFNGDSIISSKILSLTREPFATVLITHYRPEMPPRLAQMMPPGEISPSNLYA
ncbi:MAG: hypothetical protein KAJ19_21240, partial [Gammaproteobacteria bacterium]|nr:hypothetical protein [Gammaproteobacteria bacterium]